MLLVWTIGVPSCWRIGTCIGLLTWWRHPSGILRCQFLRNELFYIRARRSCLCISLMTVSMVLVLAVGSALPRSFSSGTRVFIARNLSRNL